MDKPTPQPESIYQQIMDYATSPAVTQAQAPQAQSFDLPSLLSMLGLSQPNGSSSPTDQATPQNYDPASLQGYAQQAVAQAFPGDPAAWDSFNRIVNQESGWNPKAANPTSTARGLMQFLDTTAPSYGLPADASQASPVDQIHAGINYIASRYGNPSNAWQFHLKNGWY